MKNPKSLLVLTAHCDDVELWAGGTVSRCTREGCRVQGGICFHSAQRREETRRSSLILGYEPIYRPNESSISDWVDELLQQMMPEVLLLHPGTDPHYQHRQVYEGAIVALTRHKSRREYPKRWYTFDTYYLTRMPPSASPVLINIESSFERKCESLNCHQSQEPRDLIRMAKSINSLHGQKIRCRFAEAFYPFDLLGRWPHLRDLP